MARKKKLRPGPGAIAEVLTKFIKPVQPVHGPKHRSTVILQEEASDGRCKKVYRFYYEGDSREQEKTLMWANYRYVKVIKEGDHMLLFGGPGEPLAPDGEEPNIEWRHSKARRILVEDVKKGVIKFDDENKLWVHGQDSSSIISLKDIYSMHPEYAEYLLDRFEDRLMAIHKKLVEERNRAETDLVFLEEFMEHNPISYFNKDGEIQWQGSEAQEQAWVDLEANVIHDFGYRAVFEANPVYYENLNFDRFRDIIRQEIKTEKYLHTVEVRDLQKKEKEANKGKRKGRATKI